MPSNVNTIYLQCNPPRHDDCTQVLSISNRERAGRCERKAKLEPHRGEEEKKHSFTRQGSYGYGTGGSESVLTPCLGTLFTTLIEGVELFAMKSIIRIVG